MDKIIGAEFKPVRYSESEVARARAALADYTERGDLRALSTLPMPRPAAVPVMQDAMGDTYLLAPLGTDLVRVPYSPRPASVAYDWQSDGGFLPVTPPGGDAGISSARPNPIPELQKAALRVILGRMLSGLSAGSRRNSASGTTGDTGAPAQSAEEGSQEEKKNEKRFVDSLRQKLIDGAKEKAVSELLAGFPADGIIGGFANLNLAGSLSKLAGLGLDKLTGLGTDMLLANLFPVDDSSSTAEHAAAALANEVIGAAREELLGQALDAMGLGSGDLLSIKQKLLKKFGIVVNPNGLPALRALDADPKAELILPGSPNVTINHRSAAREGDTVTKTGELIVFGSATVKTNGLPTPRVLRSYSYNGAFPKSNGSPNVRIGGPMATALPADKLPPPGTDVPNSCPAPGGEPGVVTSAGGRKYDPVTNTVYDPATGDVYPLKDGLIFDPSRDVIYDPGDGTPNNLRTFNFETGWNATQNELDKMWNLPEGPAWLGNSRILGGDDQGNFWFLGQPLGNPGNPGAGTGNFTYVVPDQLLGYNMAPYYVPHDFRFNPSSLANIGNIIETEIFSFASGVTADPLQFVFSTIYSSFTTAVAGATATGKDLSSLIDRILGRK